jgi:PII-like signaling protein
LKSTVETDGGIVHQLEGERVLMRILMSETDKYNGKPAYQEILKLLRERHLAGATVLRGSMSFGSHSQVHTDRMEVLSFDMPISIECVETEDKIKSILPELDSMIGGGIITLERAEVIVYRPGETGDAVATP